MLTTKMNTGKCRFSYLNAVTPRANEGGIEKYSVQLLVPKTDTVTVKKIKDAMAAAHANDKEGKNLLKGVATPKNPLHDGDGEKPNGGFYEDCCKGHWVMNASSASKPGLVDINSDILPDPNEWYSGIYGRAAINFYAYNTSGNKGIACGLNHLQKLTDGEPLGGGVGNPTTAFDDDYQDDDMLG